MNENTNVEQTTQGASSFFELFMTFWNEIVDFFTYIFADVFLGKNP
jgi:hypothetical protein